MNSSVSTATSLASQMLLASPLICLAVGALVLLICEGFVKLKSLSVLTTKITLFVAFSISVYISVAYSGMFAQSGKTIFGGFLAVDTLSGFSSSLLIGVSFLCSFLLRTDGQNKDGVVSHSEVCVLFLLSLFGAVLFSSATELMTLFLGLEIMSLALYALCGSSLSRKLTLSERLSSESALKYFLLGSYSSAFFLFGIVLLYGLTGSTIVGDISTNLGGTEAPIVAFAVGCLFLGIIFKIGGVPLHFWVADVYDGAPTIVTAFMATVIKSASIVAALRLFWITLGQVPDLWIGPLWTVSAATIIFGNIVAMRQRDAKRMLAYSSISHAGYLLMGLLLPLDELQGGAAMLFYLVSYSAMTLGAFAVLLFLGHDQKFAVPSVEVQIREDEGNRVKGISRFDISAFRGLGYRTPFIAASFSVFLFALAGLPPGMAGMTGKIYLLSASVHGSYLGLVIIALIGSAISCYYYLRFIVEMYFYIPRSDIPRSDETLLYSNNATNVYIGNSIGGDTYGTSGAGSSLKYASLVTIIFLCSVLVIGLGLYPSPLYQQLVLIMANF